jgi:hypothetical protein
VILRTSRDLAAALGVSIYEFARFSEEKYSKEREVLLARVKAERKRGKRNGQ